MQLASATTRNVDVTRAAAQPGRPETSLFGGHTFAASLKAAALLFGCFLAGVIGFVELRDYAETFPPKTFLWTWLFWASIAVLLLANVAMMVALERVGRAVRLLWSRHAAGITHTSNRGN